MSYTWLRTAGDVIISKSPVLVGSVVLTPDAADSAADVTFYDGESAQDPQLITIRSGTGITRVVRFQPPLQTQRGLYVDVGDNVEEVLVQYEISKE